MRQRLVVAVMLLLLVASVTTFPSSVSAQSPPSLSTDQKLYTQRDTQVSLQGIGYDASKPYAIWVQSPLENSTQNSGLTFVTTDKGEIPPAVSIPIDPNAALGTYLLSISNSTGSDVAVARAHYGLWGTDKFVYQRTEVIQAKGGGILPKAALKVTVRDSIGNEAYKATLAANETGTFLTTWRIPPDAPTEEYTVFIDGTGSYDSPSADFVSKSKFSVTPAILNVTVLSQPNRSYERMQTISTDFVVQYPDSTLVTTVKDGLTPIGLYAGQFKVTDLSLTASGAASGVWTAQFKIPRNATLDEKYKLLLAANAFDDGNGNAGPVADIETSSFDVMPASLLLNTALNSTYYQIPFDAVTAYTQVSYPDGTPVSNATVRAWWIAGNIRSNATVTYDEKAAIWIVRYQFLFGDLLRFGTWTLSEEANDVYGNKGSATLDVTADPYLFLAIVLIAIAVVLLMRWLLSRYWHRIYLGTKRVLTTIRSRLGPPSLGRYFSDSPVTP